MFLAACLLAFASAQAEPVGAQVPGWMLAQREIELSDLIDACSALLNVSIEYRPEDVAGRIAARIDGGMTPNEVWGVAQQALAGKGFTSVQQPGSRVLQVVSLATAPALARLEDPVLADTKAGFVKVLVHLERTKPEELSAALTLLLSKSGTLTNARDGFLVSDLLPHARQVLAVAKVLDSSPTPQAVVEVPVEYGSAVSLVALLDRIGQASKTAGVVLPKGTLLANPERQAILLLSDAADREFWIARIRQFDKPQDATTVAYTPRRFGVEETAKLLEQSIPHQDLPWRAVTDELTGSIILTTTRDLHEEANRLMNRLESQDLGPRRAVRSFALKHRSVASVAKLVEDLVQQGALANLGPVTTPALNLPPQPGTNPQPPLSPPAGKDTTSVATNVPRPGNQADADLLITIDEPANRLVALGEGRLLDQLGLLIESLDVTSPQVLVETIIVNLSDTKTRELGIELRAIAQRGSNLYAVASLFGIGAPDPSNLALAPLTGTGASGVVLQPGDFSALVRALETVNEGRVVTIPKVLVANNEQAELGSTLQTPYVSTNASTTVATTSFGGSLDAGTTITVKPQIAAGDQLVIAYSVSLSSFVGQAAAPQVPPPRQENRIQSVATVPDGSTVVIGGLEVESDTEATSRVPWLGAIPIVGHLFKDESKTKQKIRFFVFLRCSVLRGDRLEDLKYVSQAALKEANLDDGWPTLEPRVIR